MKKVIKKFINNQLLGNTILFVIILCLIISSQLFSNYPMGQSINRVIFNVLIVTSLLSIKQGFNKLFTFALITVISIEVISFIMHIPYLEFISEGLKILFFTNIVYQLVRQVASSKRVDNKVILEAINVYLLLAIIGSLFATIIYLGNNNAFLFNTIDNPNYSDFFYFATITVTTIGYGDITPVTNSAQLLTMILGLGGQLYITLVLAMLVGKYLSAPSKK